MSLPVDIRPGQPGSSGDPAPRPENPLAQQCLERINKKLTLLGHPQYSLKDIFAPEVIFDVLTKKELEGNFPIIVINNGDLDPVIISVDFIAKGHTLMIDLLGLDVDNQIFLMEQTLPGRGRFFWFPGLYNNHLADESVYFGKVSNEPEEEHVVIAIPKRDQKRVEFRSVKLPKNWREALGDVETAPSEPTSPKQSAVEQYLRRTTNIWQDEARVRREKKAAHTEHYILARGGMNPKKADQILTPSAESKPSTLPAEKTPNQEDYDMFIGELEEKLREMNVLPQVQKLDPAKVFLPETIIQEHFGDSRNSNYLGRFGISSLPFLFYGDVSKTSKVKVDVEFERDYVQLILEFPQVYFFSLEDTGNGPHIKKRFYESRFQLKPEAIPVGPRQNSEFISVIGSIPNKLFSMSMGSVEEPMGWQRLFKDGRLVDRSSLSKGDLFERAKKRIDNLPPYSGFDMKVAKGTKTAVLEGQSNIHIRAISKGEEVVITLTGLRKAAVGKWLESNPKDFSTLPPGGANDNDWLVFRAKIMAGELKIQAAIAGLNPAIKRDAEVRPQKASVLETPLMLARLLNSLKAEKKVPAVIYEAPERETRNNFATRNNRYRDRNRRP